jgi:predicted membrane channel-forming protein YqfA (hemolysin III family)
MTEKPDHEAPHNPPGPANWRQPFGMILIMVLILLWCGIVVSMFDWISELNFWLQLPIFIFAGIIWIFPLKPLLIWMNTGSFRS